MAMREQSKRQHTAAAIGRGESAQSKQSVSPQEEYKDDILVGLKQVRNGQVIDADQSLREIRRELGIDEN